MIVFVPMGDATGDDDTRNPGYYEEIAAHLVACGAREWSGGAGSD